MHWGRTQATGWQWLPFRDGLREDRRKLIESWLAFPGVSLQGNDLYFGQSTRVERSLAGQDWRFFVEWELKLEQQDAEAVLELGSLRVKLADGQLLYRVTDEWQSAGSFPTNEWFVLRLEVDLDDSGRGFNCYLNGECRCDYLSLDEATTLNQFVMQFSPGTALRQIWGVGYNYRGLSLKVRLHRARFVADYAV